METEWAENRAKLPQDIIRRTVGKIIDFAYSMGEQDQYRVRLERQRRRYDRYLYLAPFDG